MKKVVYTLVLLLTTLQLSGQQVMTPELLWQLGRVSPVGLTTDKKNIVYRVSVPSVEQNSFSGSYHIVPVTGGKATEIKDYSELLDDPFISPDGKFELYHKAVPVKKTKASEVYPDLPKSSALIYDALDYRHWDTWNDGTYNHVFYKKRNSDEIGTDIMKGEPFHSPQQPFGGSEDYCWAPGGSAIVYVAKKSSGTAYATSTNTDLFMYHLESGKTENLTENNPGYDTHPAFATNGALAWLQMQRDGYEADKNDIIVKRGKLIMNVTAFWDGTVDTFTWSEDGNTIYFIAAVNGTRQLFEVTIPYNSNRAAEVKQLSDGDFDVTSIIAIDGDQFYVTRTDMNHASEIFSFNSKKNKWLQLTTVNDKKYNEITLSTVKREYFTTTDGQKMLTWVIYPPNFDPSKKYPTLLYCQGGPQSALSQFYSFRWNFQVMAAQGYIIVAPNRRGMPGHGVKWNEQISQDWGGQVMDDYLTAIDEMSKKSFVDKDRLGAIGASYGGYSVFYLAGIHENRFKTFISHCGVFNLESMYGTTEEVFFTNWDMGGAYWEKDNPIAQKTYQKFNPKNLVGKWNTPILIIQGGKDYRVPIGQGQEAFQAAQLQGIKSKFLYLPDENHWVLQPQNALIWQREFFNWLKETL